ncbi:MAG: aspartate carbamoyltransferase [Candidatus Saliniplasma sp.]
MVSKFNKKHVVSIKDFTQEEINLVLDVAEEMTGIASGKEKDNSLDGKILGTLFFEPSTRTRLSFESAMKRLGGSCIGFARAGTSSVKKGETLADTIQVIASYVDVIVLRHPQEGAARLAAKFSNKPILNAGDGAGQHPTQTLLDLFTIRGEKGEIKNKKIGIAGDLKYGRTVHSLTHALSMYGCELTFIAPPSLQIPDEIIKDIEKMGIEYRKEENILDPLPELDVLYMTRIQRERFPSEEEYLEVAETYTIKQDMLDDADDGLIIMHPLPRVDEISADVDETRYAKYFKQAANGVPIRMALLKLLTEGYDE